MTTDTSISSEMILHDIELLSLQQVTNTDLIRRKEVFLRLASRLEAAFPQFCSGST